jgi:alpha-amylase
VKGRGRTARLIAAGASVVMAGGAVAVAGTPASAAPVRSAAAAPATLVAAGSPGRDVLANLWEWNWPSVARECTSVLGPAGYGGVQVAPPADHLSRDYTSEDAPILHPWWEVYQPVRYSLTSRMGNEQQFKDMVATCRRAGVKVYVDTVINHMTGQGTKSYGGNTYTHFSYPGLYSVEDFHQRGTDCPSATGGIDDFNDYRQVLRCELVGLADLRTDRPATRTKIVGYLNKLIGYGVSGFRVDAAKHIGQRDLLAIQSELRPTLDGDPAYFALEVFPGSPGQLSQRAFTGTGDVLGFDYAYQVKNAFKSYPAKARGNITSLRVFGESAGLVPGGSSLVFIQNHDTERGSETLSYKDGATNVLANQFMLAYPYGTPQVYSAFSFTNGYDSPPADADGYVTDTNCRKGWVCVNRYTAIRSMVGFRNFVQGEPLENWFDDSVNLIAFSRGDKGFFAANNAPTAKTVRVQTGLPGGRYCDIVDGGVRPGGCAGARIDVSASGIAKITVQGKDAIAFRATDLVRG